MANLFDRAYYERSLERNQHLAAMAQMPNIREAHLRLAEFYALALDLADDVEGPVSKKVGNWR